MPTIGSEGGATDWSAGDDRDAEPDQKPPATAACLSVWWRSRSTNSPVQPANSSSSGVLAGFSGPMMLSIWRRYGSAFLGAVRRSRDWAARQPGAHTSKRR